MGWDGEGRRKWGRGGRKGEGEGGIRKETDRSVSSGRGRGDRPLLAWQGSALCWFWGNGQCENEEMITELLVRCGGGGGGWGGGGRKNESGSWGGGEERTKETDSSVSSGRPLLSEQSLHAGLAQLRVMLLPGH